jgi:hypothetical protein
MNYFTNTPIKVFMFLFVFSCKTSHDDYKKKNKPSSPLKCSKEEYLKDGKKCVKLNPNVSKDICNKKLQPYIASDGKKDHKCGKICNKDKGEFLDKKIQQCSKCDANQYLDTTANPLVCKKVSKLTANDCNKDNKPFIEYGLTNDRSCGSQCTDDKPLNKKIQQCSKCDTNQYLDTTASPNICKEVNKLTANDCNKDNKPFIEYGPTNDRSCGEKCADGKYLNTKRQKCEESESLLDYPLYLGHYFDIGSNSYLAQRISPNFDSLLKPEQQTAFTILKDKLDQIISLDNNPFDFFTQLSSQKKSGCIKVDEPQALKGYLLVEKRGTIKVFYSDTEDTYFSRKVITENAIEDKFIKTPGQSPPVDDSYHHRGCRKNSNNVVTCNNTYMKTKTANKKVYLTKNSFSMTSDQYKRTEITWGDDGFKTIKTQEGIQGPINIYNITNKIIPDGFPFFAITKTIIYEDLELEDLDNYKFKELDHQQSMDLAKDEFEKRCRQESDFEKVTLTPTVKKNNNDKFNIKNTEDRYGAEAGILLDDVLNQRCDQGRTWKFDDKGVTFCF